MDARRTSYMYCTNESFPYTALHSALPPSPRSVQSKPCTAVGSLYLHSYEPARLEATAAALRGPRRRRRSLMLGLWVTRPPRPSPPCRLRLSRALFPFASAPHVHFGSAGAFAGDDMASANARVLAPSMLAAAVAALTGMRATCATRDQPAAVGPLCSLCAATCCDIDVAEASAIP